MRRLPRQQQLQPHGHDLRLVPPQRFSRNDKSEPRAEWVHANLSAVSQHDVMGRRNVRSFQHRISFDRRARRAAAPVCRLPRKQQLQHHSHDLRLVSFEGFPGHHESESRARWIPANMSAVSQHYIMGGREFRSLDHRLRPHRCPHRTAASMR